MPESVKRDDKAIPVAKGPSVLITHFDGHWESPSLASSATKHWLLVLVMAALGAGAALAVAWLAVPTLWQATALVRVGRAEVFGSTFTDPAYVDRVQQTVTGLAEQSDVESAAWTIAGVKPVDRGLMSTSIKTGSELLLFSTQARNPAEAQSGLGSFLSIVGQKVNEVYNSEVAFEKVGEQRATQVPRRLAIKAVLGGVAGLLVGIGLSWVVEVRAAGRRSHAAR